MKKYILFLFILTFVFTLFNINVRFVHANDSGCTSSGPYSTTTGKLCDITAQEFKMWSIGENVREFQQVLKDEGFLLGKVDGIYGPITDGAARKYYKNCPPEGDGPHTMMKYRFCLPANQIPTISSLLPDVGLVGSLVTVYGNGFTGTGNKIKFGDTNSENSPRYIFSTDTNSITFVVPSTFYAACLEATPACKIMSRMIIPGTYEVSVINEKGTSNAIKFTVNPTYVLY